MSDLGKDKYRTENGNPRAHHGCELSGIHVFWYGRNRFCPHNYIFGVAAVRKNACTFDQYWQGGSLLGTRGHAYQSSLPRRR